MAERFVRLGGYARMPNDARREELLSTLEARLETPMLVLSAAWLALLVIELLWGAVRPLEILGLAIWAAFVLEFAVRFALAPRKLKVLGKNLVTVLALAAPAFRLLRVARVLRFARLARGATLLRVVAGANRSMNALRRTMRRRGFSYVVLLTLVVCVLGALGMRAFETGGPSGEAFDSFGDALWWTAMILTTMGSQAWPATAEGRILALLLSVYAFAVFGYVAAALASFFIGRDQEESAVSSKDVEELQAQLRRLEQVLERRTRS